MADLAGEAEPVEPAGGEHDRVEPALAALAQPRVDVPAQRLDRQLRLEREQLCAPPHRRGADPHPGPQLGGAAERVAGILARQVRADGETVGVRRGHVLRRVHGGVDPAVEQRLLELLDEDAALTDLAERAAPVAVAGGRDRDERDLAPRAAELVGRERRLRQREPAAARADADEHQRRRVVEAEQVPQRLGVAAAVRAGRGLLQAHGRQVQQLVDDPSGDRLDLGLLGLRQPEPRPRARELGGANLLGPRPQRGDRRHDVAGRLPLAEALGLRGDDRLRPGGLAAAAGEPGGDDRLEVVDVVEEAVVELVDRRVEVARNGEVDQEQRPALAAAQRRLDLGRGRASGRTSPSPRRARRRRRAARRPARAGSPRRRSAPRAPAPRSSERLAT